MRIMVLLMVFLTGCQVTQRYHHRGVHIDWFCGSKKSKSIGLAMSKSAPTTITSAQVLTEKSLNSHTERTDTNDSIYREVGEVSEMIVQHTNQDVFCENCGSYEMKPDGLPIEKLRQNKNLPKPKPNIFKPKDREDRLELAAFLCYSVGLALVLLSWALTSEWIFGVGAFLLFCGCMSVLVLGINKITYAFNGYMTIFTILGAIYLIGRFGWLDDLLSAWKH